MGWLPEGNQVPPSRSATRAGLTRGIASGVKMTGPYDWVPPGYWLQDSTHGGAWAYNTETSPGAAVPPIESMRKMIPAQDIKWPLDTVWFYHAAGGQFTHLLDVGRRRIVAAIQPDECARMSAQSPHLIAQ